MDEYSELLARPEWKAKRDDVAAKRGHSCEDCGRAKWQRPLEVHHRYYRYTWMPWEYPDQALVVLCRECHEARHHLKKIPVFDASGHLVESPPRCSRCGGGGYIPPYNHVAGGICFRCWGSGLDFEKTMSIEEFELKNRKKADPVGTDNDRAAPGRV